MRVGRHLVHRPRRKTILESMSRSIILTPRCTHKLWPLPPGVVTRSRADRESFHPVIIGNWVFPPPPTWNKRRAVQKSSSSSDPTVEQLTERAEDLRYQAQQISDNAITPTVREQFGLFLLKLDAKGLDALLKKWGMQSKEGSLNRAAWRFNLRHCLPTASSVDCDFIFQSFDTVHVDGSIDGAELRVGLAAVQKEAAAFNNRQLNDVSQAQVDKLLKRAMVADQAAKLTAEAQALEADFEQFSQELFTRADVRLGALLTKRMIKPEEFVLRFSKPGPPSQVRVVELLKSDFRKAVLELLAGRKTETKLGSSAGSSHRSRGSPHRSSGSRGGGGSSSSGVQAAIPTSVEEIDAVFDKYDEDGGGSMDMEEAKVMVKGLHLAGREAEQTKRRKEQGARTARANASKKAALAMEDPLLVETRSRRRGSVADLGFTSPTTEMRSRRRASVVDLGSPVALDLSV